MPVPQRQETGMQGKREQWSAHLAQWRGSGLSQTAYCREHGLADAYI